MADGLGPYLRHGFWRKAAEHLAQAYLAAYLAAVIDVQTSILYLLAQQAVLLMFRTVGARHLWNGMRRHGLKRAAATGLLCSASAMVLLPFALDHPGALGAVAILHALGSALYYGALHAGLFAAVGAAPRAGRAAVLVSLSTTAGFVGASVAVFGLTLAGFPSLIPLPAAAALLVASADLKRLDLDHHAIGPWPGWRAFRRAVSPECLLANFNPEHIWMKAAMPLAAASGGALLAFGVSAGVTLGSVVGVWIGGMSYDRRRMATSWAALAGVALAVLVYAVGPVSAFGLAAALYTIAGQPIGLARDARTAAETAASDPVLAAAAFEAARAAGGALACAVLAACYWTVETVPTWLPAVGLVIFAAGPFRYAIARRPSEGAAEPLVHKA